MEVTLLDAGSLPKGCLLSVKAGTTRRQAPADAESFRLAFPKYAPNIAAANPLKVDLLAVVGTATLNLDEAQDSYKVELPGMDGQLLAFELGVRSGGDKISSATTEKVPGVCLDNDAINADSASRRHRLAVNARRYLDDHGLMSWAQTLFQDIIHQQPEDPWAFIDEKSKEARQSQAVKTKEKVEKQTEEKEQQAAPVEGTSLKDMDELRQAACMSLVKAATGGHLEKVLGDVKRDLSVAPVSEEVAPGAPDEAPEEPQDWDDLKAKSLRALSNIFDAPEEEVEAPADEETVPADIEVAPSVAQALGVWHNEAKDEAPPEFTDEEVEALRQEAMVTLSNAAAEGTLQEMLMKRSADKPEDEQVLAGDIPVEDLRQQAQGALCEAVQSGKLKEVLSRSATREVGEVMLEEPGGHEIDVLRGHARDALAKAVESGTLQEVLETRFATEVLEEEEHQHGEEATTAAEADDSIEALREEAREALSKAVTNGGLEEVLASNQEGDIESLRLAAQKTFGSAVADGRLSAVLGDSRRTAELAQVAAEALAEAEAAAPPPPPPPPPPPAGEDGEEGLPKEVPVEPALEGEKNGLPPLPTAGEEIEHEEERKAVVVAGAEAAEATADATATATATTAVPAKEQAEEELQKALAANPNANPEELEELRLRIRTAMSAASETNELEEILAKTKGRDLQKPEEPAPAPAAAPPPPAGDDTVEVEAEAAEAVGTSTPPELKEVRADIRNLQAWTDKTREELNQMQESAKGELQHICDQARETGDLLTELRDHTLSLRATAGPGEGEAPASSTAVEAMKQPEEEETMLVVEDIQDDKEEAAFPEGVNSSLATASELVTELESKLRSKNEVFRQENEALRKENERLKNLRQLGEATKELGEQNAALREA
mmetsp:Transcript_14444/g.31906  ORF Transcript_14444/g.31906 Transcript_14444/m.31906 type:complete len:894 (-) Transcript_14444:295-2976(-)